MSLFVALIRIEALRMNVLLSKHVENVVLCRILLIRCCCFGYVGLERV